MKIMKIKRFFYVASPRGTTGHRMYGSTHSEGKTACGRVVSAGWLWKQKRFLRLPVCKNCENAL